MKKRFEYIIERIWGMFFFIWIVGMGHLFWGLFLVSKTGVIHLVIEGILLFMYFLLFNYWILKPYRESKKIQEYFQKENRISEKRLQEGVFLTPSCKHNMEIVNKIMHSMQFEEMNKRQAQYLALQNQINPHFLYNTLESIRGEALIGGLESVAVMTEALARFFRYTISKVENLVTVEEELDNCETYFQIQKYRFGDRIDLEIVCDKSDYEEIMKCKIPKLTLQPVVENSIIHGIELKLGKGKVEIVLTLTKKRLNIHVKDDGIGMDERQLNMLNKRIMKKEVKSLSQDSKGGIALVNVNDRIKLLFGEEYGVYVYSMRENGTDVEISLPRKEIGKGEV